MPAFVSSKQDEAIWKKAKARAAEEGQGDNYAYVTAIYKKMGGSVAKSIKLRAPRQVTSRTRFRLPVSDVQKAEKPKDDPAPAPLIPEGPGWQPVPGSAHGGYRRKDGEHHEHWYPTADHAERDRDHHDARSKKMRSHLTKQLAKNGARPEHIDGFLDQWEHHLSMRQSAHHHATTLRKQMEAEADGK